MSAPTIYLINCYTLSSTSQFDLAMPKPLILLIVFAVLTIPAYAQWPAADAQRLEERIKTLATHGANADGGVDRVAYSQADLDGRAYVRQLMEDAGLEVRVDAGGNIIGRRAGSDPDAKPIMFGSHIDSVPGGGNYDGPAGVLTALEVIELFNQAEHTTRHPLDMIVFSNEEGGLVGSLALTGKLRDSALDVVSHSGLTIAEGTEAIGGNLENLEQDQLHPGDLEAFVELHIEQGAVLDNNGINIGVVEGIVGIGWWDVTLTGIANHAGTTPMYLRDDAMLAAAELTIAVNEAATSRPGGQVATVGRIQAFPGAPNVIPGRVEMSLEIRDLDQTVIDEIFVEIQRRAAAITTRSGVTIEFAPVDVASQPAPTDSRVQAVIANAAEQLGLSHRLMPSGAGHDAQDMVAIAPTGMIFVPSQDGLSHTPREFTSAEDLANGANVLLSTIAAIDDGALQTTTEAE